MDAVAENQLPNGFSPLHSAAQNGSTEEVMTLLNKAAPIDLPDDHGWTPLHIASFLGREEVVTILKQYGADLNARCNRNPNFPYSYAPLYPKNVITYTNRTPLHLAALNNQKGVISILLGPDGADIDVMDGNGWTPLHVASFLGHTSIVQELVSNGANMEIGNDEGWTPLHEAATQGHSEVIACLVDHGANLEARNMFGNTPLHWAIWHGHYGAVDMLLRFGADIFARDKKGISYWEKARMAGHDNLADRLEDEAKGC